MRTPVAAEIGQPSQHPWPGQDGPPGRRRLRLVAVVCGALALAVVGVGFPLARGQDTGPHPAARSGPAPTPIPVGPAEVAMPPLPSTGTRTSPVRWQLGPTRNKVVRGVLAGYQAYVAATVRLAESPDPSDPELTDVAIEPQLGQLRASLLTTESRRGRLVASARVLSVRAADAVLVGCVLRSDQVVYDAADKPVRAFLPRPSAVAVQMTWDHGRWKVARTSPTALSACRD